MGRAARRAPGVVFRYVHSQPHFTQASRAVEKGAPPPFSSPAAQHAHAPKETALSLSLSLTLVIILSVLPSCSPILHAPSTTPTITAAS